MTREEFEDLMVIVEAKLVDLSTIHIEDRVRLNELMKDFIVKHCKPEVVA